MSSPKRFVGSDAKVELLINGPWKAARNYLEEAALPDRTSEQLAACLGNAAARLRDAEPLQEDNSFGRAFVCIDLALVLTLTGDESASRIYARRAVESAVGYLQNIRSKDLRPPGYGRKARNAVINSTVAASTYGLSRVLPRAVGRQQFGVLKFDDWCNEWLQNIYNEFGIVEAAAGELIGRDDPGWWSWICWLRYI